MVNLPAEYQWTIWTPSTDLIRFQHDVEEPVPPRCHSEVEIFNLAHATRHQRPVFRRDVAEWCEEHFRGHYMIRHQDGPSFSDYRKPEHGFQIAFDVEADWLYFKMRW